MSDAPERIWISSQAVQAKWVDKTIPNPIRRDEYYDVEYIRKDIADKEKQEAAKSIREVITCYKTAYDNAQKCPEMILSSGSTEKAKVLMRELEQARIDLFGVVGQK